MSWFRVGVAAGVIVVLTPIVWVLGYWDDAVLAYERLQEEIRHDVD